MTETITIVIITFNEDFCEDGYDSDGEIGTFLMQLHMNKILNITQKISYILWLSFKEAWLLLSNTPYNLPLLLLKLENI